MKDKKTKKKIMREREIYFHWTTAIQPKSFRTHVLHEERERARVTTHRKGLEEEGFGGFSRICEEPPEMASITCGSPGHCSKWAELNRPKTLLIKRYFSGTVGHQINVTRLSMHISLLPNMRSGASSVSKIN